MPAICVCPHTGSPQALPQLKRALQGERSPCPRLLPPRSQQLTGSCSEPPSSPHPAPWGSLRCAKSRPGKQTGKVSLLWWLFSCCLQRRCDCFTGAGARHHSHTRVSRVSLTSPTDLGLPFIMGSSWCGATGPLSPALGTPHSQGVELGPVSLLDLALFGGSKLLQHS